MAIKINMDKARTIHMDRLRAERNAKLSTLDIEWQKAMEAGDMEQAKAIAARKQTLRDMPVQFDLTQYETPEALAQARPEELN